MQFERLLPPVLTWSPSIAQFVFAFEVASLIPVVLNSSDQGLPIQYEKFSAPFYFWIRIHNIHSKYFGLKYISSK